MANPLRGDSTSAAPLQVEDGERERAVRRTESGRIRAATPSLLIGERRRNVSAMAPSRSWAEVRLSVGRAQWKTVPFVGCGTCG